MVKTVKKGSLTVEAALLAPLLLLVIMGILYLFFWVHNRAWLTAAAYEAAVSGSIEGIKDNEKVQETAEKKGKELGDTGFFGADDLTVQATGGKKVQVVYDLDTISGFGGFSWHLRAKGSAAVLNPVSWIRKAKAASELIEGLGSG